MSEKSQDNEWVYFDEYQAFKNQLPSTFYADLTITYRINRARYSAIWALQVKNMLGEPIYEGHNYNYKTQRVQMDKSVAVIPAISYTIEF